MIDEESRRTKKNHRCARVFLLEKHPEYNVQCRAGKNLYMAKNRLAGFDARAHDKMTTTPEASVPEPFADGSSPGGRVGELPGLVVVARWGREEVGRSRDDDRGGGDGLGIVHRDVLFLLRGNRSIEHWLQRRLRWRSLWRGEKLIVDLLRMVDWDLRDKLVLGELGGGSLRNVHDGGAGGEPWAMLDAPLELGERDAFPRVGLEDETEDLLKLDREWEDGPKEAWLLTEGTESAVREMRALPWVASASQVDEDNTERPDVVGDRVVASVVPWRRLLTFRRHVKCGTAAKIRSEALSGGQTKVRKLDLQTAVAHKNVLGLQVAMVDAQRMAVLDGADKLQKHSLCHIVVADISAMLGDVCKEVPLRTVLHNNVGAIRRLQDLHQRNNVLVPASLVVKANFTLLEATLPLVQACGRESLDGVGRVVDDVDGVVDDSVSTNSKHRGEF